MVRNFNKNLMIWVTPMNQEMNKPLKNWRGMLHHLNTMDPELKRHIHTVSPNFGSYLVRLRSNINGYIKRGGGGFGEVPITMLPGSYWAAKAKAVNNYAKMSKSATLIQALARGRHVRKRFAPRLQALARVRRQAEANARAAKKIEEQRLREARQAENNAARATAIARSKAEANAQRAALKARRNATERNQAARKAAANAKAAENAARAARQAQNNAARAEAVARSKAEANALRAAKGKAKVTNNGAGPSGTLASENNLKRFLNEIAARKKIVNNNDEFTLKNNSIKEYRKLMKLMQDASRFAHLQKTNQWERGINMFKQLDEGSSNFTKPARQAAANAQRQPPPNNVKLSNENRLRKNLNNAREALRKLEHKEFNVEKIKNRERYKTANNVYTIWLPIQLRNRKQAVKQLEYKLKLVQKKK